jgi:hypothetical protein
MANLLVAICADVAPLTLMLTVTDDGATAPTLEIVNSQAFMFWPDDVVISTGGQTSVLPAKVTPGIAAVSLMVIPSSVKTWVAGPPADADAANATPRSTRARPSGTRGLTSFRMNALHVDRDRPPRSARTRSAQIGTGEVSALPEHAARKPRPRLVAKPGDPVD